MSAEDRTPATPDETVEDLPTPGSDDSSENTTPLDGPALESPMEVPKRMPSLRSVSDPRNMNPNSTALGVLGRARNPQPRPSPSSFVGSAGAMDNSFLAKARALQQQRTQMGGGSASSSPSSPSVQSPGVTGPNGFPGNLRLPGAVQRPAPQGHANSAPALSKPSLSERRANMGGLGTKLSAMGGGSPSPPGGMRRAGAPKLSDMNLGKVDDKLASREHRGSKMDDFKKYIDTEKGWITFDGAATITRTGVNFSNGHTFSISLDEVEILSELGKGNYGTVYKVKHAKPKAPRFGLGLSGVKSQHLGSAPDTPGASPEDESPVEPGGRADGTTGMTMAMKEVRLELDDAKFTTILKELVILHECVSPYIIDFYGAFFQEGAVYICIEYMDGGSIDKIYAGGIPENVLRKVTYSTIQGLKTLKDDHNIIHRDVKPTNILINTRGQVKICDFGVSGNLVASIAKTNIGCQSYMAPERISGGGMALSGNADGSYNVQSDVWSLGLTIIECAMGQYPYPPEISSTIFSQLSAIVEGEPPGLPEQGYSDLARDFVKACLHKVPKMRPTYAMLLKHPWLNHLDKPQTIAEEAEEGEEAERVADAVGNMKLESTTADEEVADWVKSVLRRKQEGDDVRGAGKPALHTVPLDGVSPQLSPQMAGERSP